MYYKPHTIQVKARTNPQMDDRGHPIFSAVEWEDAGVGRCDEANVQEITDANGNVFRPSYHIVIEGRTNIKCGDIIRCMNADGTERGGGEVKNVKNLNYLKYSEVWV